MKNKIMIDDLIKEAIREKMDPAENYEARKEPIRTRRDPFHTIESEIAYYHDNDTGNELYEFLDVSKELLALWESHEISDAFFFAVAAKGARGPILTVENVRQAFIKCLYREVQPDGVRLNVVDGIHTSAAFDPDRVDAMRPAINALLDELPDVFKDGMSFLNLCADKDGRQWGEHNNCDQLLILGLAVGRLEYLVPQTMWDLMPGGMPYLLLDGKKDEWLMEEKEKNDGKESRTVPGTI